MERYFLKGSWQSEHEEVTKEEWIKAERIAGFRPKMPSDDPRYMKTCATAGFTASGINGKIEFVC